jgi:hypothetical protein
MIIPKKLKEGYHATPVSPSRSLSFVSKSVIDIAKNKIKMYLWFKSTFLEK